MISCAFGFYEPLRMSEYLQQNPFLLVILPYLPVALALFSLFLNVYAYVKKIEPLTKDGRPITIACLIFSFIFLVIAVIPICYSYIAINSL